ncbi:MAG: hypothetical protein MZV63_56340 [Marinilabiliales bacterium]|nr:hypothetical protein [Marinilabiliales bacterium]
MEVKIDETPAEGDRNHDRRKIFPGHQQRQAAEQIYQEIDKLEKSKIDVTEFRKKKEEFLPLALLALGIFVAELACVLRILKIYLRNVRIRESQMQ